MTARTTRPLSTVGGSPRPSARRRLAAVGAVVVAGSLLLTACGDQTDGGGDGDGDGGKKTESANAAPLHDKLPADIRKAGVIKVGSDIAYAPIEFYDENDQVAGVDPDLADALEKQLGVEFKFSNGTFDQLVLGMNSGRFDIVMSAMTDTKERQQGESEDAQGGADFVDYFRAGSAILVKKGNPEGIESLDDLCGRTVALQRGTANEDLAEEQSEKCDKPIKILAFEKDTDALLQVKQGRAVADINDYPVAAYNAKTSGGGGDFEVVGDQINAAPYGIAVSKKNTELRDAIKAALDAIIDNGEYQKVLEKWDVAGAGVEEATVNGGE
ncbi:atrA protein [Streptomyces carminius]|uniref:AtrA protein n=1 Tax=Streptomyces carminius TaxID=2665496 RepID=A0A2M8LW06_9ACTN|nr:ABC transporter substrate-binding protein [Streptomyces carminius]PJE96116.1 atrA protein [Streptomyces carminius]